MTFANIIDTTIANVGMSGEWIALIITILGALIFFAKDFKLGMIVLLTTSAGLFIWFYEQQWNYVLPLVIFFMSLVIMALSLYAVNKSSATGGFT